MKKTLFNIIRIKLTFLILTTCCFSTSASLAQHLPVLGDASRETLSPITERKLGEEIMLGIRHDKDYIDDAVVAEYLNDFGSKLLEVHQEARGEVNFPFYFFAVRDNRINAFALPGGFIGVHSELILTAQNESQLASVLAHEIGHVAQRHIARMLGNQKQDLLIPLSSLILAALTMHSNPDAAIALAVGGQGLAAQRQLDFSQNAEREADRIGLQILRDGGYDPSDMVAFFERMQNASRGYSENFPAFLRTHPMTTERIADIQLRIQSEPFKKHQDNPDFQLFRAHVRVLQDESIQGLLTTKNYFEEQIASFATLKKANPEAEYGLALIAFKQNKFNEAQLFLDKARKKTEAQTDNLFFACLQLDILLHEKKHELTHELTHELAAKLAPKLASEQTLKRAEIALQQFPQSRAIGRQYAEALIANQQVEKAIAYLRDQTFLYRSDFLLHEQLAKAYAAAGKEALQHLALAESYALSSAISPALDQLNIARHAADATYYDLAVIDAHERDLKERYKEELEIIKAVDAP